LGRKFGINRIEEQTMRLTPPDPEWPLPGVMRVRFAWRRSEAWSVEIVDYQCDRRTAMSIGHWDLHAGRIEQEVAPRVA
jgi:hypothetical protein